MVHLNDLLVPEGSAITCQYQEREIPSRYYEGDKITSCYEIAQIRLPTAPPDLYCYAHAMDRLRRDLSDSRYRLEHSQGASILGVNNSEDIETITEIMRQLERYASEQMSRR